MTRLDKLFLGVAVERPTWIEASGAGTEDIGPEDTCDADYGRLLEAVQNRGKGLASPRGILPFTMRGSVEPQVAQGEATAPQTRLSA